MHQRRATRRHHVCTGDTDTGLGREHDVLVYTAVDDGRVPVCTPTDAQHVLTHPRGRGKRAIDVVEKDRARLRGVHPGEKSCEGGLARAGAADDKSRLARGEEEGEVGEHGLGRSGRVSESDIVQSEFARASASRVDPTERKGFRL